MLSTAKVGGSATAVVDWDELLPTPARVSSAADVWPGASLTAKVKQDVLHQDKLSAYSLMEIEKPSQQEDWTEQMVLNGDRCQTYGHILHLYAAQMQWNDI